MFISDVSVINDPKAFSCRAETNSETPLPTSGAEKYFPHILETFLKDVHLLL